MRKVIGIGETILDIIFKENQPTKAIPGGSVFNAMVSLSRLEVPICFISELGQDKVGEIIIDFMRHNRISTDHVDIFCDGKSPLSLAFLDDNNDAQYVFYTKYPDNRLNVVFPRINENDIVIFGSYYSVNPVLRDRTIEILEYAKARKAIIYYDPNFRNAHAHESMKVMPAVLENLEYADIVRGSVDDFKILFGESIPERIYKNRVKFYCPNFICTSGANGVDLFAPSGSEHFNVEPVKTVSTISAGDNFNAGILFGILKYNITLNNINSLSVDEWSHIVSCGIDLSREACKSYDNYISESVAETYLK